jgi:hypothetical protein
MIKLPPLMTCPDSTYNWSEDEKDVIRAIQIAAVRAALEAAAYVLTVHQIPVGNSAAGELACELTYDALKECRDNIRALRIEGETP